MASLWARFSAALLTLLAWGVVSLIVPADTTAVAAPPGAPNEKSWTESISSSLKKGVDKVGSVLTPKASAPAPGREDDAISLSSKGKPGPGLYIALAHVYEQSGKMAEAELQYQLALKDDPNALKALLGYAQLEEYLGRPNEAIAHYQRAAKAHPQEASVHNNLGLCYARQNRPDEAIDAMSRGIQLAPKNPLYRNNIAAVLVEQGKPREALAHLREVHSEAAACYNMGYLLNKKGETQAALQHFQLAMKADPSMESAKRWVGYLQKKLTESRLARQPTGVGLRPASPQVLPNEPVKRPPTEQPTRRLPPTVLRQPSPEGPSLPGISYDRATAPAAPMPPPPTRSALRPLPRVN